LICKECRKDNLTTEKTARVSTTPIQKRHRSIASAKNSSRMQQMLLEAEDDLNVESRKDMEDRKAQARQEELMKKSQTLRMQLEQLLRKQRRDFMFWCEEMESTIESLLDTLLKDYNAAYSSFNEIKNRKLKRLALARQKLAVIRVIEEQLPLYNKTIRTSNLDIKLMISAVARQRYTHSVLSQALKAVVSPYIRRGQERIGLLEFHVRPEIRQSLFERLVNATTEIGQVQNEAQQLSLALREAFELYQIETRAAGIAESQQSWGAFKHMVDRPKSLALAQGIIRDIKAIIKMYQSSGRYERRRPYRKHGRFASQNSSNLAYLWELRLSRVSFDSKSVEMSWHYFGHLWRKLQQYSVLSHERFRNIEVSQHCFSETAEDLDHFLQTMPELKEFPYFCYSYVRDNFRRNLTILVIRGKFLLAIVTSLKIMLQEARLVLTYKRFCLKHYTILEDLRRAFTILRLNLDETDVNLLSRLGLRPAASRIKADIEFLGLTLELRASLAHFHRRTNITSDTESVRAGLNHLLDVFEEQVRNATRVADRQCRWHGVASQPDLAIMFMTPIKQAPQNTRNKSSDNKPQGKQENAIEEKRTEPFGPGGYQIAKPAPKTSTQDSNSEEYPSAIPIYSHTLYRNPEGKSVTVHYCTNKTQCETYAKLFLNEAVVGFDMEWSNSAKTATLKQSVSLIQIASESRVALFQIATCTGTTSEELLAPSLRKLIESESIIKCGVNVAGDGSRLARYLNVRPRGLFELSRYHNILANRRISSGQITRVLYSLDKMVSDYLGCKMHKGDVRMSNWAVKLSHVQCCYAAADAYASLHLFHELERRCKNLDPAPERAVGLVDGSIGVDEVAGVKSTKNADLKDNKEDNEKAAETNAVETSVDDAPAEAEQLMFVADRKMARRTGIRREKSSVIRPHTLNTNQYSSPISNPTPSISRDEEAHGTSSQQSIPRLHKVTTTGPTSGIACRISFWKSYRRPLSRQFFVSMSASKVSSLGTSSPSGSEYEYESLLESDSDCESDPDLKSESEASSGVGSQSGGEQTLIAALVVADFGNKSSMPSKLLGLNRVQEFGSIQEDDEWEDIE
jgi:hypothetical protein